MTRAHQEITLTIPGSEWISQNGRYHWATKARRTRTLRALARLHARRTRLQPVSRVFATAYIQYPHTVGRADPANAAPTVKALIDGLVDAGILPDDDHTHLEGPLFKREPGACERGLHVVRLTLTPLTTEEEEAGEVE